MAMKGHKKGCKCVGCDPATRKRGQAALKRGRGRKSSSAGEQTARRGSGKRASGSARRGKRSSGGTTRTSAGSTTVVVQAAAPAAPPCPPKGKRGGGKKGQAQAKSAPRVGLPDARKGEFLVILASGRQMKGPIKVFDSQARAEAFVKTLTGKGRAMVVRVASNWS